MRIVTFNVNSLQRLLGHPLQHIFKEAATQGTAAPAAAASVPASSAASQPHAQSHSQPVGEQKSMQLDDERGDDDDANAQFDVLFGANDDEAFDAFDACGDGPSYDDNNAAAAGAHSVAAASSPVVAAVSSSSPSLSSAAATSPSPTTILHVAPLLRTQAQLDAYEHALATSRQERLALLDSSSSSAVSSLILSSARLTAFLDGFGADVICLQEVKMARNKLPESWATLEKYEGFFAFSRRRQGYSGVVTFVRKATTPTLRAEEGFTGSWLSAEAKEQAAAASAAIAAWMREWTASRSGAAAMPAPLSLPATASLGCFSPLHSELDASTLKDLDSEGRCIVTDHAAFVLFNVYFPNATEDDAARQKFKATFYRGVQARAEALLDAGRHVVIVGDVNACHQRIDHADFSKGGKWMKKKPASSGANSPNLSSFAVNAAAVPAGGAGAGVASDGDGGSIGGGPEEPAHLRFETHPARSWLHRFLRDGGGRFVDVFRVFYPMRERAYTCWNTKTGARVSNYGARIDYILADEALVAQGVFTSCEIRPDVGCSDHCPVHADLALDLPAAELVKSIPQLASRNMPEFSGNQQSIASFFAKGNAAAAAAAAASASASMSDAGRSASAAESPAAAPGAAANASLKRPLSLPSTFGSPSSSSAAATASPSKKARASTTKSKSSGAASKTASAAAAASSMSLKAFFGAKAKLPPPSPASTVSAAAAGGASPSAGRSAAPCIDLASDSPVAAPSAPAPSAPAAASSLAAAAASSSPTSLRRSLGLTNEFTTAASMNARAFAPPAPAAAATVPAAAAAAFPASAVASTDAPAAAATAAAAGSSSSPSASSPSASSSAAPAAAWAALLDQKSASVRCRCGMLCKLLTVTKGGANQGRRFYICPLPPPGRCDFFLWAVKNGQNATKGATSSKY